jgi:phosphatidylinositol alpha-1,6-mannosyltransferase
MGPLAMTRILLVTNDWPPKTGGIQTYLQGLVERTGHDVDVLGPDRGFMFSTKETLGRIEAAARDADVVWFGAPHPPGLLGPELELPYVVHTHGAEIAIADALPGVGSRLRRSLQGAAEVLSVSAFTAGEIERRTGRPALVLGVGVDLDRFTPGEPPDRFTVLTVGRLVPRKGQGRVIEAVGRLRDGGVDAAVVVVGEGREEARLRRLADRLGVPTTFETDVPDQALPDLYRQASVFAMPTKDRWMGREAEGLGIVYLEASASGLPVIVGPSGGSTETIVPGTTGFVAADVKGLARQLAWLAEHREEARAMGVAGRQLMDDRFSWSDVIARFDAVMDRFER